MSNYSKPLVLANEELAEGVYAASGEQVGGSGLTSSDCWRVEAAIHQVPETGRGDYRLQVDAWHTNPGKHRSSAVVTIVFNQTVTVTNPGNNAFTVSGTGTVIKVGFDVTTYNPNEHRGWGDLYVTSDAGLKIVDVGITCTGI